MITVETFSKPEEANLLRCRLEAAGIPAFVRDELTVQMYWLYSNALGGVRVEVPDKYAESAREILSLPPVDEPDAPPAVCPRCGSEQVIRREWPKRIAYLSLLLAFFPLLFTRNHSKCKRCNFKWR
jgi:hypothetical protein